MDYCHVFISCLDSHSDGTHSLQSIHWWAFDVMLQFSKSVPMNKLTFWVNCSFNMPGWVQGVYFHYSKLFFFNFIKLMSVSYSDRKQIQGLCASFKSVLCCLVIMQQQTTITVSNWCAERNICRLWSVFGFFFTCKHVITLRKLMYSVSGSALQMTALLITDDYYIMLKIL